MTVAQHTDAGTPDSIVRRVIVYDYGTKGRVVDTTRSISRTLAPISERMHKANGEIHYDVDGNVVHGGVTLADSSRSVHDTLPGAAFNSTDLELVVRSLPLAEHYRLSLPIYDPERGGYRMADVRVVDRARASNAWVVIVRDHDVELTYRLNTATRQLMEAMTRNTTTGVEFHMLRMS